MASRVPMGHAKCLCPARLACLSSGYVTPASHPQRGSTPGACTETEHPASPLPREEGRVLEETSGSWFHGSPARPRAAKVLLLLFYLLLPGWGCLKKPRLFTMPSGPRAGLRAAPEAAWARGSWRGQEALAGSDRLRRCVCNPRVISGKPNSLAGCMHVRLMGEEVSQPWSFSQVPFISYSLYRLPKGPGTALIGDGGCGGGCRVKYACFLHE